MPKITDKQQGLLQTLYSQYANHTIGVGKSREDRLAWATGLCRRKVTSFSGLSLSEANHLIDSLQGELGKPVNTKPRLPGDAARRAGLDGRKDGAEFANAPALVSSSEMETIHSFRNRLGWNEDQFRAWMESKRGPLAGRVEIRTVADANRVRWALKGMLQARGLWQDERRSA